jgi:hypothetical protein
MAPIFGTYVPTQAGFGSEGEGEGAAMSEQVPSDQCDCFGDLPWSAVCDKFRDDDQGVCLTCGHCEECHGNDELPTSEEQQQ